MRLLNSHNGETLDQLQLYLSPSEAREVLKELQKLLEDPERNDHFHVFSEDGGVELSCSIVTGTKLKSGGYTAPERAAFGKWKPRA